MLYGLFPILSFLFMRVVYMTNIETTVRQTLALTICYDIILTAVKSIGTINNNTDVNSISIALYDALKSAANEK